MEEHGNKIVSETGAGIRFSGIGRVLTRTIRLKEKLCQAPERGALQVFVNANPYRIFRWRTGPFPGIHSI